MLDRFSLACYAKRGVASLVLFGSHGGRLRQLGIDILELYDSPLKEIISLIIFGKILQHVFMYRVVSDTDFGGVILKPINVIMKLGKVISELGSFSFRPSA